MFTIKDFEEYENENRKDLQDRTPVFIKHLGPKFEAMWDSGYWLEKTLLELGAKNKEIDDICFVQGQKSYIGDPVEIAIELLNEYAKNNKVKDKPGAELAKKVYNSMVNSSPER